MTFWTLLRSIFVVCLCAHPILLGLLGLADALMRGQTDGLFAVFAMPMTLAFFGPPALLGCLLVIVPTYYAFSRYARRPMVPFAVFSVGTGVLLYLFVAAPVPSGYEEAAQGFTAASLMLWALYAFFRMDLQQR